MWPWSYFFMAGIKKRDLRGRVCVGSRFIVDRVKTFGKERREQDQSQQHQCQNDSGYGVGHFVTAALVGRQRFDK